MKFIKAFRDAVLASLDSDHCRHAYVIYWYPTCQDCGAVWNQDTQEWEIDG